MLSFLELDPKTDETLNLPPKVVKHTYLEVKLGLAERLEDPNLKLYTAKLYDGVTEADLIRLREEQGLHLLFSNARTAYFGDAETCQLVDEEILQNFSDAVAYGSLPVSDANASTLRANRRVLIIDDEADPKDTTAVWGDVPLLKQDGTQVDPLTLLRAASALGDSFGLIAPALQRELTAQETLEPLQGRLAVAQTLSFSGTSLDAEGIKAQLIPLLHEQLWDVAAFQQQLLPNTEYEDQLTLETKVRPDGSAIVQWRYTTRENPDALLKGKALVGAATDGTYQVTLLGGTTAQQAVANQEFNSLVQSQNTPFQFRAGVPEWQGVIKGTCRASNLCQELEVDAIIPKSAIKGDGKTTPVGLHTVEHLFWSRKAEAQVRQQKLGAQVLVNLPEGTRLDIEPKVEAACVALEAAVSDPRLIADLYCAKYERRKELLEAQSFEETEAPEREDWVYRVLKADARPTTVVESLQSVELQTVLPEATWAQLQAIAAQGLTVTEFVEQANGVLEAEPAAESVKRFTVDEIVSPVEGDTTYPTTFGTVQRGGYGQLLEHEKVADALNRFLQNEWRELALGGINVPSALAQPHSLLQEDEVCFTGMPHGAKVAIYRSPVSNVSAFTVLTNNLDAIREQDWEAFCQNGVTYLNPATAKAQLIDFDGDTVALIPELELQKVKAQPFERLKPNEVYVPGLAHGQAVTLYHRGNQVSEFVNNTTLAELPEPNTERDRLNQVYVHPDAGIDPEQPLQLGYYDGLHGFKALHTEITQLNLPEHRPVQTEKEKKIPRNAYDPSVAKLAPEDQAMAARFTTKESAALDAADNPTGLIANVGMRLEALRTELKTLPDDQKAAYLSEAKTGISKLYKRVSDPQSQNPLVAPQPTKDGYDFVAELQDLAQGATAPTAANPVERLEQVNAQLAKVERFLFQVEGLNAINLQRGVDTPKSARTVSQDWLEFSRAAVYKDVAWVNHRKDKDVYLTQRQKFGENTIATPKPLANNTQDAIGRLVALTNKAFSADPLDYQEAKAYDAFLVTSPQASKDLEAIQTQIQTYKSANARATVLEQKAQTEEGPTLQLQTRDGAIDVTNLTRFDPEGTSPLWDAVRTGEPLEINVVDNDRTKITQGKAWQTQDTKQGNRGSHDYAVMVSVNGKSLGAVGTLCNISAEKLAEAALKRANPSVLYQLQKDHAKAPEELPKAVFARLKHETGSLTERQPETVQGQFTHAGDKTEAKALRQAANAARQEWAATVPPEDREYWARLAWSNQGQGFALAAFPDVVSRQAETFQFTQATVIGLQYEDWEGVDWTQEPTLRIAIGAESVNPDVSGKAQDPHYGKMILQAETDDEWKLVGTLSSSMGKGNQKDFQYPVGLLAKGTLETQTDTLIATTESGLSLTVKPVDGSSLKPTEGAERHDIRLISEGYGSKAIGYIASWEGEKLGKLDKESYTLVTEQEKQYGKIFNQKRRSSVSVVPGVTKTATLVLKPETVQVPEVWSKHNVDSWLRTLRQTGAEVGQVTSEPDVNKDVLTKVAAAVETTQSQPHVDQVSFSPTKAAATTETQTAKPAKVLPTPSRLRGSEPTTTVVAAAPAAPTVQRVLNPLEAQYKEAQVRIGEVFDAAGCTPTPEQVDQAIATSIYRETPDLAEATKRLQVLTKSPVTQRLFQEQGFEAATAYVTEVTVNAYQRVQATKTKAVERNGNGRY
ncbi:hypothetical protein H6F86_16345 [Phormidium sp. FACHB-592]|uniref:Uncharacterized protein n=1 Tax=Stenomitos frigidus AS-A4 TaxID=2933935 RepID=A0ABV0KQ43_9CYAN|nr:hypothetical protein [Phormidium sp. FACHB-592]MBD2075435.1 hypothetical protein [Phormidium sp. FACHB-592]